MKSARRIRRYALLPTTLLALQLAATGAVPLADAVHEAATRRGPEHVESPVDSRCPPGHDHLHCQFCRFAGESLIAASPIAATDFDAAESILGRMDGATGFTRRSFSGRLGARAPPLS